MDPTLFSLYCSRNIAEAQDAFTPYGECEGCSVRDVGRCMQGGWAGFLDADHSDGEGDEDEISEEFQPSSDGADDDDDSDSDSASVVNSSDEDDDVRPPPPPCGSSLVWRPHYWIATTHLHMNSSLHMHCACPCAAGRGRTCDA